MTTLIEELSACGEWKERLSDFYEFLEDREASLAGREAAGESILPPRGTRLRALKDTQPGKVKVFVCGQDVYPTKGHGMGLAFSVNPGVKTPRSLSNIYKEINRSLGHDIPEHGDLSKWASSEGVMLLNSVLTVKEGVANSHKGEWEAFTDQVIREINAQETPVVFLLWGKYAHKKEELVTNPAHIVIKTSHPSPLGATKSGKDFSAFMGSDCFKRTNEYLESVGIKGVDWKLA
ncbi:uracil-DNA glycosylase [Neptuniibacter sp. QD37_11]|uniref:uracil-DNA glycosylase n=1 Tax=Neptuniibacter sp. QD37_11 TaxID=3398209 RepID=UPI0039F45F02